MGQKKGRKEGRHEVRVEEGSGKFGSLEEK
jgi:hypothetical protein